MEFVSIAVEADSPEDDFVEIPRMDSAQVESMVDTKNK